MRIFVAMTMERSHHGMKTMKEGWSCSICEAVGRNQVGHFARFCAVGRIRSCRECTGKHEGTGSTAFHFLTSNIRYNAQNMATRATLEQ